MRRVVAFGALWAAYCVGHRVAWFKWESKRADFFTHRSGS